MSAPPLVEARWTSGPVARVPLLRLLFGVRPALALPAYYGPEPLALDCVWEAAA